MLGHAGHLVKILRGEGAGRAQRRCSHELEESNNTQNYIYCCSGVTRWSARYQVYSYLDLLTGDSYMLDKTSRPCLCFEHCERFEELASYFSPYGVLVSVLASLGKFTCIVLLFMHSCFIVEWSPWYRWHWSELFSSRKLFLQLLQHLKQQQHKQYLKNSFKFEYDKTKTKPITYRLHYSGNLKP